MKNYKELFGSLVQGEYPNIKAQNATGLDAQDGTPYTADVIDDIWGFHQALMSKAALTPNGNSETAGSSQILDAIRGLSRAYATCSTAAGTASKTVTVTGFELKTGAQVTVKFTNTNTHESATLNVSGTGAAPIWYKDAQVPANYIRAKGTYLFAYNGMQWEIVGDVTPGVLSGSIPFNSEWTYVNNGSGNPYRKTSDGFVQFWVYAYKSSPIVVGDAIFTLPSGFKSSGGSAIFPAWFSRLTSTETGFGALKLQSGTISVHSVPTINSTGVCALVSYFAVD